MKVTTEELERCEVLLTIEVEPAKEQDLLRKAAKRIARQTQIPGFRPGKAPYNTVVRRFGLEAIQQEALKVSGEKLITDALKEADLRPTAQISFDNISWNPLTVTVKVPTQPRVELGDYRERRLDFEPVEVTAEDVEAELKVLQEQNAAWAPVERPAQLNDLIAMSVVEKDGDEVLAEHESVEYELTAPAEDAAGEDEAEEEAAESSSREPDLTTPLLGLSAGEEKTFSVTYADDYDDERYAGKEITFTVQVSSVKEKDPDPLDDEFAQSISEYDTLAALRERIESNLRDHRELERDQKLGEALLDELIEEAEKIEWPATMEEEMIDEKLKEITGQFERSGLTLDSYLQIENKSEEDLREDFREDVVDSLKRMLVLAELLKTEKLSVSNVEILERAKLMADVFGGGSEQVWRSILASESQQSRIANDLLVAKVMLRLAAIAKGEAPALDEETAPGETAAEAEDVEEQATAESAGETAAEVEEEEQAIAESAGETTAEAKEEEQAIAESAGEAAAEAEEENQAIAESAGEAAAEAEEENQASDESNNRSGNEEPEATVAPKASKA